MRARRHSRQRAAGSPASAGRTGSLVARAEIEGHSGAGSPAWPTICARAGSGPLYMAGGGGGPMRAPLALGARFKTRPDNLMMDKRRRQGRRARGFASAPS